MSFKYYVKHIFFQKENKLPILFLYHSHKNPIRIPKDMGMVWEAYHKGSHYWESLESPLNI